MRVVLLACAVAMLPVPLAGCACRRACPPAPAAPVAAATVPAQRYENRVYDSALDFTHGGGRAVHSVFLPGAKVLATLHYDGGFVGDAWKETPRVTAHACERPWRSGVFVPTGETPPLPEPLHDIAVPEDLARRIAEHAAATERLREESLRLGEEVRARLRLEPIPDPRSQ